MHNRHVDNEGSKSLKANLAPEWSDELNARRCDLIDKKIDDVLTPEEAIELEQLQTQMLAYRRKVAPRPLDEARKVHQQLLKHGMYDMNG